MGILPKILTDKNEIKNENIKLEQDKYTYIVDFVNGKMEYHNGRPLITDNIKAIKMYIQKLLITELGEWEFHKNYGTNYRELTIHKRFSSNIIRLSLIKQNLKQQLLNYSDIKEVNKIEIKHNYNTLIIKFNLILNNNDKLEWEEEVKVYEFR